MMDYAKKIKKLSDDELNKVGGGAAGYNGQEIPDYARCPFCSLYDMVKQLDHDFFECVRCGIGFDKKGEIWEQINW